MLLQSAVRHGFNITVLGWGDEVGGSMWGKIDAMLRFLTHLEPIERADTVLSVSMASTSS